MKKNRIISAICITVVLVFTLYVMLDTFVLSATYDSNAAAEETAFSEAQNKLLNKDETTGTETEESGETVTNESAVYAAARGNGGV